MAIKSHLIILYIFIRIRPLMKPSSKLGHALLRNIIDINSRFHPIPMFLVFLFNFYSNVLAASESQGEMLSGIGNAAKSASEGTDKEKSEANPAKDEAEQKKPEKIPGDGDLGSEKGEETPAGDDSTAGMTEEIAGGQETPTEKSEEVAGGKDSLLKDSRPEPER